MHSGRAVEMPSRWLVPVKNSVGAIPQQLGLTAGPKGTPGSSTPPAVAPASEVNPVATVVASCRRPHAKSLPDCDTARECMVPQAICGNRTLSRAVSATYRTQ